MDAHEERRGREEMEVGRDTSDFIIGVTQVFNTEQSYEAAMNGVLEMISRVLRPQRLIIFERGEETTSCTFEWHAPGVPSQKTRLQDLPNAQFDAMAQLRNRKLAADQPDVVVSEVDAIKNVNGRLYQEFDEVGIQRMMAVPLFHDGDIIGYLSANNFRIVEGLDAKRVLDTVAPFISARIVNQRLVDELERTGTHDQLTGLLNRWGIDAAIDSRLGESPDDPYVLALVDIDDFKVVNDQHGHDVGDAVLVALARTIERCLPEGAIIGRNGGDELLVMLFGADALRADELLRAFSEQELYCELRGERYGFSTSIGYAGHPDQAADLHDAYAKADEALYAVKFAGKAGVARYSKAFDQQHRQQIEFSARAVVENMPAPFAVYRATGDHEILFANDDLIAMLGYDDLADFMDCTRGSFASIVHPDDAARILGGFERSPQSGDSAVGGTGQYRLLDKAGSEKRVSGMSLHTDIEGIGSVVYTFIA